ncbi:hypothetical protein ACFC7A_27040 [Streptomyces niveus]|uniref:hypothetical protein n=1 Tax=Streptomyces niveus TaxID=193462 RepID=UPI0035D87041
MSTESEPTTACDVTFENGTQCAKPAGHWVPGSSDMHMPAETLRKEQRRTRWQAAARAAKQPVDRAVIRTYMAVADEEQRDLRAEREELNCMIQSSNSAAVDARREAERLRAELKQARPPTGALPPVQKLALATEFRVPLPGHPAGSYGEIVVKRERASSYRWAARERAGSYRWAVTDGAVSSLRIWTDGDGWRYLSDIGRTAAYRHTLDEALLLAERAAEFEATSLAKVLSLRPDEAAVDVLPSDVALSVEEVLVVAERLFQTGTGRRDADRGLCEDVLSVVLASLPVEARADYLTQLERFAEEHRGRLEQLYREFGPDSAIAAHGRYQLVGQPVSIVLCERLDERPLWLAGVWDGELPGVLLADIAEAWGVRLP